MFGHFWDQHEVSGQGVMLVSRFDGACKEYGVWPSRVVTISSYSRMISIYDLADTNPNIIALADPIIVRREDEMSLAILSKHLHVDAVIKVLEEVNEKRFYDIYPSSSFYDEIVELRNQLNIPEWQLYRYSGWRVGLRKDITYLEGSSARSILVAENGVTLFLNCVDEVSDGKGLFITAENLSQELLAGFMAWEDAIDCFKIHRMLRRWIYTFALRRDQLEDD